MKEFKQVFLWGMNMKFFMGLYFTAMVFLSGAVTLVFGGDTLSIWTLLQMCLVAISISIVQVILLPDSVDFLHGLFFGRSIIWLIFASGITGISAYLGNWFMDLAAWGPWLLSIFMGIGCIFMLLGIRFEQEADTKRLNESLNTYKKSL